MQESNESNSLNQSVSDSVLVVEQPLPAQAGKQSNFLIILLSILLLISCVIAGFFAFQTQKLMKELQGIRNEELVTSTPLAFTETTPDPTADLSRAESKDWKTYTNTVYKYSLKYPSNWEIVSKGGSDATKSSAPVFNSPCNYESGQLCSQVFVEIGIYNSEKKFEADFVNLTGSKPDRISNKIVTTVSGETAERFDWFQSNYGDSGRLLNVLITNNNNIKYIFTYEESQKGMVFASAVDWQNKKTFDQILSTFKFLD